MEGSCECRGGNKWRCVLPAVRVFGHSLGGLAALAAEAKQPGTFAAMYLFEPVVHSRRAPAAAMCFA